MIEEPGSAAFRGEPDGAESFQKHEVRNAIDEVTIVLH